MGENPDPLPAQFDIPCKAKKKLLYSLFDRPKRGFVRPKKCLAGHHDRRPTVRYFEP